MASDSLFGGTDTTGLSASTKGILDGVLADTQGSTIQTTKVGSATFVQGLGANNEAQGALVGTNAPTTGTLTNGNFVANVNLPANVGLTIEGLSKQASNTDVTSYLKGVIDKAIPAQTSTPSQNQYHDQLVSNLNTLLKTGTSLNTNNVVRVVNVTDDSAKNTSGSSDIHLNASTQANTNDVLAINMFGVNKNNTLVLTGVDKALVVGAGSVKVDGSTPTALMGDSNNQLLVGGAGADTIYGGGGSDTLTGGSSADTFGFNSAGRYTVSDFSGKTGDAITFNIPGITSLNQLAPFVTSIDTSKAGQTTYNFAGGNAITLVGVSPADITAGMVKFIV